MIRLKLGVWTRKKKPGIKFSPRVLFSFFFFALKTRDPERWSRNLAKWGRSSLSPSYWLDLLSPKAKVILLHLGQAMGKWLMLFSLHWLYLCTDHGCSAGFQVWRPGTTSKSYQPERTLKTGCGGAIGFFRQWINWTLYYQVFSVLIKIIWLWEIYSLLLFKNIKTVGTS